ncbi:hypothetical protein Lal_00038014 [Lupinus albus]|nr:hypothetical protein Lal_00038014 [Lupinus albus]
MINERFSKNISMDARFSLPNTVISEILNLKTFYFLTYYGNKTVFYFCCESNDIYPELVRVFYCNMNFRKNLLTSHVKGKDIILDTKTFSSLCCDMLGIDSHLRGGLRPVLLVTKKIFPLLQETMIHHFRLLPRLLTYSTRHYANTVLHNILHFTTLGEMFTRH